MVRDEKIHLKNGLRRSEHRSRLSVCVFFLLTLSLFTASAAVAQDDLSDILPPPVKSVAKDDLARLKTKTGIKDRTKLSLELMDVRLSSAEKFSESQNYDGAYRELGVFHGLMDDSLKFLTKNDNGKGKVLDNFKRFEIGLRGMAPRIEIIRRELPLRYDAYIQKLIGYLRNARKAATEAQFDDTVIPKRKPD